jgi:hypothetical protein
MSTEEFYNQEFSVPPDEHPMLRIIEFYNRQLAPADIEVSLNEFLESNDGLTDDEIDALSNLKLNGYYDMGVHFGWVRIQRIK